MGHRQEIIRGSKRILLWWIKCGNAILGGYSKMARGMRSGGYANIRVSYVLIQAPPNAKGFEKAEVSLDVHS